MALKHVVLLVAQTRCERYVTDPHHFYLQFYTTIQQSTTRYIILCVKPQVKKRAKIYTGENYILLILNSSV